MSISLRSWKVFGPRKSLIAKSQIIWLQSGKVFIHIDLIRGSLHTRRFRCIHMYIHHDRMEKSSTEVPLFVPYKVCMGQRKVLTMYCPVMLYYRWIKNGFAGLNSFRGFHEICPRTTFSNLYKSIGMSMWQIEGQRDKRFIHLILLFLSTIETCFLCFQWSQYQED